MIQKIQETFDRWTKPSLNQFRVEFHVNIKSEWIKNLLYKFSNDPCFLPSVKELTKKITQCETEKKSIQKQTINLLASSNTSPLKKIFYQITRSPFFLPSASSLTPSLKQQLEKYKIQEKNLDQQAKDLQRKKQETETIIEEWIKKTFADQIAALQRENTMVFIIVAAYAIAVLYFLMSINQPPKVNFKFHGRGHWEFPTARPRSLKPLPAISSPAYCEWKYPSNESPKRCSIDQQVSHLGNWIKNLSAKGINLGAGTYHEASFSNKQAYDAWLRPLFGTGKLNAKNCPEIVKTCRAAIKELHSDQSRSRVKEDLIQYVTDVNTFMGKFCPINKNKCLEVAS